MTRRKLNIEDGVQPGGDPALAMIVNQLKLIQSQQNLIAQNLDSLKVSTNEKFNEFQRETVKAKTAAEEGLRAAMEAMYKHIESKVMDPVMLQKQIETAQEEAEKNANLKRAQFTEILRDATTGSIINYEAGTVSLTVNGITWDIRPGVNMGVPAPFIELWENRNESLKEAIRRDGAIQGMNDFGTLEAWRSNGRAIALETA